MTEKPIVFVVNNDVSIRDRVRHLVESMNIVCSTFGSGSEFLEHYQVDMLGCAVLDLRIADISGLQIQRRLVDANAPLPLLFLSPHATIDVAVCAMRAGAVDFFDFPFDDQRLWEAIQQAIHICRNRLEHMEKEREWQTRLTMLKDEEVELLNLIVEGRRSKDIASSQKLSLRTVEARRARLMKKLQLESTVELVHVATATSPRRCRLHGCRCYSMG